MDDIEFLAVTLRNMNGGADIARKLSDMVSDERRRNILLVELAALENALLKQEVKLTKRERAVMDFVLGNRKPQTAEDVVNTLGEKHKSLRHKNHALSVLDSLVKKDIIGRFRLSHKYYFTTPEDAVEQALAARGETLENFSPKGISEYTGLGLDKVILVLEEI